MTVAGTVRRPPTLVTRADALAAAERFAADIADAVIERDRAGSERIPAGELESLVLAAVAVAAERAAVLHWAHTPGPRPSLTDAVRVAVGMAVGCMTGPGSAPVIPGRVTSGTRAAAPRPDRE